MSGLSRDNGKRKLLIRVWGSGFGVILGFFWSYIGIHNGKENGNSFCIMGHRGNIGVISRRQPPYTVLGVGLEVGLAAQNPNPQPQSLARGLGFEV